MDGFRLTVVFTVVLLLFDIKVSASLLFVYDVESGDIILGLGAMFVVKLLLLLLLYLTIFFDCQ